MSDCGPNDALMQYITIFVWEGWGGDFDRPQRVGAKQRPSCQIARLGVAMRDSNGCVSRLPDPKTKTKATELQ